MWSPLLWQASWRRDMCEVRGRSATVCCPGAACYHSHWCRCSRSTRAQTPPCSGTASPPPARTGARGSPENRKNYRQSFLKLHLPWRSMSFNVKAISTSNGKNVHLFQMFFLWSMCYTDGMLLTEKAFLLEYPCGLLTVQVQKNDKYMHIWNIEPIIFVLKGKEHWTNYIRFERKGTLNQLYSFWKQMNHPMDWL